MPELFTVHAASLDDPARFKPQAVTYGVRGHAWDHLDPALAEIRQDAAGRFLSAPQKYYPAPVAFGAARSS